MGVIFVQRSFFAGFNKVFVISDGIVCLGLLLLLFFESDESSEIHRFLRFISWMLLCITLISLRFLSRLGRM